MKTVRRQSESAIINKEILLKRAITLIKSDCLSDIDLICLSDLVSRIDDADELSTIYSYCKSLEKEYGISRDYNPNKRQKVKIYHS